MAHIVSSANLNHQRSVQGKGRLSSENYLIADKGFYDRMDGLRNISQVRNVQFRHSRNSSLANEARKQNEAAKLWGSVKRDGLASQ